MANEAGRTRASPWEWVAAAASTLLVMGLITFLVHAGLSRQGRPPALWVRVERVARAAGQYRVDLRVHNGGDETAAGVHVVGELRAGDAVVETSDVTVDYVPAGARRKAALWFTHDPRTLQLQVRVTGHDLP